MPLASTKKKAAVVFVLWVSIKHDEVTTLHRNSSGPNDQGDDLELAVNRYVDDRYIADTVLKLASAY